MFVEINSKKVKEACEKYMTYKHEVAIKELNDVKEYYLSPFSGLTSTFSRMIGVFFPSSCSFDCEAKVQKAFDVAKNCLDTKDIKIYNQMIVDFKEFPLFVFPLNYIVGGEYIKIIEILEMIEFLKNKNLN